MKILLIGGAGFIGSWLAHYLQKLGHKVSVLDYFSTQSQLAENDIEKILKFRREVLLDGVNVIKGDLLRVGNGTFLTEKPEVVVHLAALPVEKPFEDQVSRHQLTKDVELTYEAVRLAKMYNTSRFVYMSSLFAYGDFEYATTEERELRPKTAYGIMKAAGEHIVKSQLDNWNIIRTTSVYGFGDLNNRATQILLRSAMKKEKAWVNGNAPLDFIYVKDLVKGISSIIESPHVKETFHISGGHSYQLADYAAVIKQLYPKFEYEVKPGIADRPKRGTLANDKAREILGWTPKYSLFEGVYDYNNYAKELRTA